MWVQLKKNLGLLSLTRQAKVCNLANEYTMRGQKYLHSCLSNVTYDKTQISEKCKDCETVREGHFRPGVKGRCVMWHLSWEERLRRRDAESPRAREESHGDEGSRDNSWRETSCLAETKQRPETRESLDTGRMGLTMRGKETQNKGWDVEQRPGEQSKCSIKQRCYSHLLSVSFTRVLWSGLRF